jgi:hypothetical protein
MIPIQKCHEGFAEWPHPQSARPEFEAVILGEQVI